MHSRRKYIPSWENESSQAIIGDYTRSYDLGLVTGLLCATVIGLR